MHTHTNAEETFTAALEVAAAVDSASAGTPDAAVRVAAESGAEGAVDTKSGDAEGLAAAPVADLLTAAGAADDLLAAVAIEERGFLAFTPATRAQTNTKTYVSQPSLQRITYTRWEGGGGRGGTKEDITCSSSAGRSHFRGDLG